MSTEEMSFKELDLKFYFVVKDGVDDVENVSSDMSAAFASIREYVDEEESIVWMTEEEVMKDAPKLELTKKFIYVLEYFDGRAFEYLKKTRALVIGPRCMLSCIMENTSIPLGNSPIFTTAMRNLIICPSGLSGLEKENLRNLVQWMGGYYSDNLNESCTHLVSNTVKSNKYEKAALNHIPIMHPDWVHDAWTRSKKENILATSQEFNKHKLPVFYELNFTSSGLTANKKKDLVRLIADNGGHYMGAFKSSVIDILITEKNKTDSEKFQAASRYKKYCLIPEWVTDSVKKGYALPMEHYRIVGLKVSTPTKVEKSVSATDFNPDGSLLSEISRMDTLRPNSTVNETTADISIASTVRSAASNKSVRPAYKDWLVQISTQQAKKSGAFLDGCCIYLAGFTVDEKEKLNKILSVGGAIRYDEMNEKITHCIVGEPTLNELKKISDHPVLILTLEWLAESIKQKLPVQEDKYVYQAKVVSARVPEPPSPSSKKTIESMNHSFKKPALPKSRLDFTTAKSSSSKVIGMDQFEDEQDDFLSQYTPENSAPLPPKPSPVPQPISTAGTNLESEAFESEMCTEDYNNLNFFINCTVHVHDHREEEMYQQLIDDCENAGAKLVDKTFKGIADYVIVPSEYATDLNDVKVKAKHIVNNIWIEEAINENKIVNVKYYHEPVPIIANKQPLVGMLVVISLYSNAERLYIETLATVLGAAKQDSYVKKQKPLLICPMAEGAKYNAAIKWNYPVVKSEWLVECAKTGEKVSLEPYLVGDSVLSKSSSWCATKSSSSTNSDVTLQQEGNDGSSTVSKGPLKASTDSPLQDDVFHPPLSAASKGKRSSDSPKGVENDASNQITSMPKSKRYSDVGVENRHLEDLVNDRNVVASPEGTPYLRHRRLSELVDPARRGSKESLPTSPITPPPAGDLNISDVVKCVSTPHRDLLYNVLKEMQSKETPESQRIRKLVATPGAQTKTPPTPKLPEFVLTPEVRKRRLAFLDSYYLPPTKPSKPSTPFSEIKKRFWKEALGDEYFEEGNYNTQTFSQATDDDAGTSAGNGRETQNSADTNIHVRRLSDFINNRAAEKDVRKDHQLLEIETESAPQKFDTEIGGTEEMIGWRDPSEFTQDVRSKVKETKHSGTPRFSISCTTDTLKLKLRKQIEELKGEVCENLITFDETCTHIICERPNRGEKILSGIAAGKWILEIKYIDDSMEAGYFLDEELYEWGNPKATNLPKLVASDQLYANAAFRWRKKLSASNSGIFQGFRVILHVAKKDQFQKLIVAGGGVVLNVSEPYGKNEEALTATHCLVEQRTTKLSREDHKALADAGVLVLAIMYLNAHITSEVQPDYTKYLLSL